MRYIKLSNQDYDNVANHLKETDVEFKTIYSMDLEIIEDLIDSYFEENEDEMKKRYKTYNEDVEKVSFEIFASIVRQDLIEELTQCEDIFPTEGNVRYHLEELGFME